MHPRWGGQSPAGMCESADSASSSSPRSTRTLDEAAEDPAEAPDGDLALLEDLERQAGVRFGLGQGAESLRPVGLQLDHEREPACVAAALNGVA